VADSGGESRGWIWTKFVLSSCLFGYFGIKSIVDLNGTADKTPMIVGGIVIALLIVGALILTLRTVLRRGKVQTRD
jgi:uncharacterized membrane protein